MSWIKNIFSTKNNKQVGFYDVENKQLKKISEADIQPYMIEANIQGVGIAWVDARQLRQGEHKHPTFSDEAQELLISIKNDLEEVHPLSLDDWEDGFRRDENAEIEIATWLHIARCYKKITFEKILNFAKKREYFTILVTCSNTSRENVFKAFTPKEITTEEAQKAVNLFYSK